MPSSISSTCKNYFQGFQELNCANSKEACKKNTLAILKIASYFTVIVPLIFGVIYGLAGRVSKNNPSSTSRKSDAVGEVIKPKVPQTLGEHMEAILKSKKDCRTVFTVEGLKIGVIFNPQGRSIYLPLQSTNKNVIFVSDRSIPEDLYKRLKAAVPADLTSFTMTLGSVNGMSTFDACGF